MVDIRTYPILVIDVYFGYAINNFCILTIIRTKINNYFARICSLIIALFECTRFIVKKYAILTSQKR
jgi:hypothetical protein